MIVIGRRSDALLDIQLRQSRREEVTYQEVGETRSSSQPPGYRYDRLSLPVGRGEIAWERAKEAIRLWKAQAHAGMTITPLDAPILECATVLVSRTFARVTVVAPCRVVYVTDLPTRFGFAYGTLPGHPERGEEAFHVVLCKDGTVVAEIVAFSRPDDLPTRLAGPLARAIQKAAMRRYLAGIEKHVSEMR